MKIALYSDLHLETLQRYPAFNVVPVPRGEYELIVLAGDIHQGTAGLDALARLGKGHIYVPGNHEYYRNDIEILDHQFEEKAAALGLHFLQRRSVEIGGVRFLGCTLWTDYRIQPGWAMGAELLAKAFLPDYKLIRHRGKRLTPTDTIDLHRCNVDWLESMLSVPFAGKTVVITHHAPHPGSIHPRFNLSPINAAFVSDLSRLIPKADFWLHGHMHDSFDYRVLKLGAAEVVGENAEAGTRVIANPRGYLRKRGKLKKAPEGAVVAGQVFENAFFNPDLVIEL